MHRCQEQMGEGRKMVPRGMYEFYDFTNINERNEMSLMTGGKCAVFSRGRGFSFRLASNQRAAPNDSASS